jgi:hypothetical protein
MTRVWVFAATLMLLAGAVSASADPGFPKGWGGGSTRAQDYEFGTAPVEGASGKQAAYIRARPGALPTAYFSMTQCINADNYAGKHLRLSARLKTVNAGAEELWMRVDGAVPAGGGMGKVLSFYNMSDRPIKGTTDWKRYDIVLDAPEDSVQICYGFLLAGGKGEAWADGLSLNAVGMDVPLSPSMVLPKAPVNLGFDR